MDDQPGRERVYAVAVADPAVEARLLSRMKGAGNLCDPKRATVRYSMAVLEVIFGDLVSVGEKY